MDIRLATEFWFRYYLVVCDIVGDVSFEERLEWMAAAYLCGWQGAERHFNQGRTAREYLRSRSASEFYDGNYIDKIVRAYNRLFERFQDPTF